MSWQFDVCFLLFTISGVDLWLDFLAYCMCVSVSVFCLLSCMSLHHKPGVVFFSRAVGRIYLSFTTSLKQTRNS